MELTIEQQLTEFTMLVTTLKPKASKRIRDAYDFSRRTRMIVDSIAYAKAQIKRGDYR